MVSPQHPITMIMSYTVEVSPDNGGLMAANVEFVETLGIQKRWDNTNKTGWRQVSFGVTLMDDSFQKRSGGIGFTFACLSNFMCSLFLLVSHLRLSQWEDETVVGWLNHFIVMTLNQQQPIDPTYIYFLIFGIKLAITHFSLSKRAAG